MSDKRDKLIICTVGTSISNNCPMQRELISKKTNWSDSVESFSDEIKHRIKNYPKETFRTISAEINSLDRIGLTHRDRVALLSSDNAPGRVCAEALKKVLLDQYQMPECNVEVKRVEGLQVRDSKLLRETGLKNFVKVVLQYLNNQSLSSTHEIIMNPTGGFKGVLPFLTTLGMLYGKKTVYIFEFSESLIILPPLPFSFDLNLFDRVRPALEYLNKEIAVDEDLYLSKVVNYTPSERDLFMSFTEPFDMRTITISPLAWCLVSLDETQSTVMLSKRVLGVLEKSSGLQRLSLNRLIAGVRNPIWRNSHHHIFQSSDLAVMKVARTAERIAGFVKSGSFHVTHAFLNHAEYERVLKNKNKIDFYDDQFAAWEEEIDLGVSEVERDSLAEERDSLLINNVALKKELRVLQEDYESLELKLLLAEDEKEIHDESNVAGQNTVINEKEPHGMNDSLLKRLLKFFGGKDV